MDYDILFIFLGILLGFLAIDVALVSIYVIVRIIYNYIRFRRKEKDDGERKNHS